MAVELNSSSYRSAPDTGNAVCWASSTRRMANRAWNRKITAYEAHTNVAWISCNTKNSVLPDWGVLFLGHFNYNPNAKIQLVFMWLEGYFLIMPSFIICFIIKVNARSWFCSMSNHFRWKKTSWDSDIVDYFLSFILGILSKWLQGLAVSLISESAQFLPVFQLSRYKWVQLKGKSWTLDPSCEGISWLF